VDKITYAVVSDASEDELVVEVKLKNDKNQLLTVDQSLMPTYLQFAGKDSTSEEVSLIEPLRVIKNHNQQALLCYFLANKIPS